MFVLMHKPTGVYMPDKKGGAGGTYINPFAKRRRQKTTPRLFARRSDALSALKWWAQGRVRMGYVYEDEREIWGQDPVAGRNAADWSVVEVRLEEVTTQAPVWRG